MRILLLAFLILGMTSAVLCAPPTDGALITMVGGIGAIDQLISVASDGGGHIYHVMPVHTEPGHVISGACLIGTVLTGHEAGIAELPSVTGFHRTVIDPAIVEPMGEEAVFAANAWNFLVEGGGEEPPDLGAEPFPNDCFIEGPGEGEKSGSKMTVMSPGNQQTSEFMIGRIAIGIILPESNGIIDSNLENWSNPDTNPLYPVANRPQEVFNRIVAGANWWATQGGAAANMTLFYDQQFAIATSYEPITRTTASAGERLWIGDVLTTMGYTGATVLDQIYSCDNAMRIQYNADWAYSMFVADSLNDTDGMFSNSTSAFAYMHGPYAVMTYDNGTTGGQWRIDRMHLVFAHEMGHIFGAPDEYSGSPTNTCTNYGYLDVLNGNSFACIGANQVACVMQNNSQQLCTFTRGHIGWRDSDLDGIYDPVDCALSVSSASLTYFVPPFWGQSQITGQGAVTATPWSAPVRTPVSINKVSAFYNVDGGMSILATPTDGSFNSDFEMFGFASAGQSDGPHTVGITASDNYGNTASLGTPLAITIDTTPPPTAPTGAFIVEAPYSANPTQCNINWTPAATDPESGLYCHRVELRPVQGGTYTPIAWLDLLIPAQTCYFNNLNLVHGGQYNATVIPRNNAGVFGPACGTGVLTIDLTPPVSPTAVLDGGPGTNQFDRLTFSWNAGTEDVSGITDYRLSVDDQTGVRIVNALSTGNVTSYAATGLSLTLGNTYRAFVQPVNGAGTVGAVSPQSDGILAAISYATIAAAKQNGTLGGTAWITGLYVTSDMADQPKSICIEQGDRSSGIRTDSTDATIRRNDCVDVAGFLQQNAAGELMLLNSDADLAPGGQTIVPLLMNGSSVGGASFGLQPGVNAGTGVNTIGLLIGTSGQVTHVSSGPPYYYNIDDGSGCLDAAGRSGIVVSCGSHTPPAQGSTVTVTGICAYVGGYPVILVR